MSSFSSEWLMRFQIRDALKSKTKLDTSTPLSREADLHDQILSECKRRGWLAVHSRMDRATTNAAGVADFIIYASHGRVFTIEAKTKLGKLSSAQLAFAAHLKYNGHECHVVRSFEEFLQAVK